MAKNERTSKIESLNFEEAIKALGEIVEKIEDGQVPLQSSIEQYEQGMKLIKHCRDILGAAEKKIEKITEENREKKS